MVAKITFSSEKYSIGEVVGIHYTGALTPLYAVVYDPSDANIFQSQNAVSSSGSFGYNIPSTAPLGIYRAALFKTPARPGEGFQAEATFEVTDQELPSPPGVFTKSDFVAEIQKRGIIDLSKIYTTGTMRQWIKAVEGDKIVYFAAAKRFIKIFNLDKHNPPTKTTDVYFTHELEPAFTIPIIDKLPFITIPFCLWLVHIGLDNLTSEHALYVYYLSKGAPGAAEEIYNRLSTKPERINFEVTQDKAQGVLFYSIGAPKSGNQKTGCWLG